MLQGWRNVTFLHWRYPAAVLQARLPTGLEIDTFDGSAWLRIAPFRLELHPALPWFSAFPETNCLTYVRGPDGSTGVWFFSLDAARAVAVAGARLLYGLPYMWSRMRIQVNGRRVDYESTRRWPDRQGLTRIQVERGESMKAGDLEIFLTARYRLYSVVRGRMITAQVEHPPWPLESARILRLEQTLTATVGLPPPDGAPLVHFSPGVEVRVGKPCRST